MWGQNQGRGRCVPIRGSFLFYPRLFVFIRGSFLFLSAFIRVHPWLILISTRVHQWCGLACTSRYAFKTASSASLTFMLSSVKLSGGENAS